MQGLNMHINVSECHNKNPLIGLYIYIYVWIYISIVICVRVCIKISPRYFLQNMSGVDTFFHICLSRKVFILPSMLKESSFCYRFLFCCCCCSSSVLSNINSTPCLYVSSENSHLRPAGLNLNLFVTILFKPWETSLYLSPVRASLYNGFWQTRFCLPVNG
jgi:hypothetical protein